MGWMGIYRRHFFHFRTAFGKNLAHPPLGNNESATDGNRNKCEDQNKCTNF